MVQRISFSGGQTRIFRKVCTFCGRTIRDGEGYKEVWSYGGFGAVFKGLFCGDECHWKWVDANGKKIKDKETKN